MFGRSGGWGSSRPGGLAYGLEPLENRRVLALIVWDGGAGTANWNDAANWAGDVVPTLADDVQIGAGTPSPITFSASAQAKSLLSDRAISLGSARTLTIGTSATVNADFTLGGGTIDGGAWSFGGGGGLRFTTSGGTLEDAQISGDLELDGTSEAVTLRGATRFQTARLTGNAVSLRMAPGYVLHDDIVVEGVSGTAEIRLGYGGVGTATFTNEATLTLAAGSGLGLSIVQNSASTLVNQGLISVRASGKSLAISSLDGFTNQGVLEATAGTLGISAAAWVNEGAISAADATLTFGGAWSHTGTVVFSDSTLNLGGSFTTAGLNLPGWTRTGGTVNLSGDLDNAGATLTLNAGTGSWRLLGGSIVGGTLAYADGSALEFTTSGGELVDLTVLGDIMLDGTSEAVTLRGATRFETARLRGNAASLRMDPGYVLHDDVVAEGAVNGSVEIRLGYGGSGTTTFAPGSTVTLAPGSLLSLNIVQNSATTVVNQGLIAARAEGETLSLQSLNDLTNEGVLEATAGTLNVAPAAWASSGSVSASGATVTFAGAWSHTGTVAITNSTLNLNGSFTNAGLNVAGWSRSGGTVNLGGELDNTGATLTLDATTGAWRLVGGTISGGTLAFADGSALEHTSNGGTLADVAVLGDIMLDGTSEAVTLRGATRFETARLRANAASLRMAPGYVLHDDVVAEGAVNGSVEIRIAYSGSGTATFAAGSTVTLAPGALLSLNILQNSTGALVNQGLISAQAEGETLSLQSLGSLLNEGAMEAGAGTLNIAATSWSSSGSIAATSATVTLAGAWSMTGTVSVSNGTLNLNGEFATAGLNLPGWTRSGGTVNLGGELDNADATITLNAATGTWRLLAGSIAGGTLAFADGAALEFSSNGGGLTDVAVLGDLLLDGTSEAVTLAGSTRFGTAHMAGSGASLRMAPGYVLHDHIVVNGAVNGTAEIRIAYGGTGTATFAAGSTVALAPGSLLSLNIVQNSTGTLINEGLIQAQAAGETLSFTSLSSMTNEGTLRVDAGTMSVDPQELTNILEGTLTGGAWIAAGGTLSTTGGDITTSAATVELHGSGVWASISVIAVNQGSFTLEAGRDFTTTGSFTNEGQLTLGPGSTLAVSGDYAQTASGEIEIRASGADASTGYGRIAAAGAVVIDGAYSAAYVDGYVPAQGTFFDVLTGAGGRSGEFSSVSLPDAPAGDKTLLIYEGTRVRMLSTDRADLDLNGSVNTQDFIIYLNWWASGDVRSDFNGDGIVNSLDFIVYLNLWADG